MHGAQGAPTITPALLGSRFGAHSIQGIPSYRYPFKVDIH